MDHDKLSDDNVTSAENEGAEKVKLFENPFQKANGGLLILLTIVGVLFVGGGIGIVFYEEYNFDPHNDALTISGVILFLLGVLPFLFSIVLNFVYIYIKCGRLFRIVILAQHPEKL